MPNYRVKSGTIELIINNKRKRVVAGEVVSISILLATKFKDHLEPLGDAKFADEEEAQAGKFSREYLRIAKVKGVSSVGDLYEVINTITGRRLNDAPLSLEDAEKLAKGIGIPVSITTEEGKEERRVKVEEEQLPSFDEAEDLDDEEKGDVDFSDDIDNDAVVDFGEEEEEEEKKPVKKSAKAPAKKASAKKAPAKVISRRSSKK